MGKNARTNAKKKSVAAPDTASQAATEKPAAKRKFYTVTFYADWCKTCGLCSSFCVKEIIQADQTGRPYITPEDMDHCSGCRFCEIHCPDFAITIKSRQPERRGSDDKQ